MIGSSHLELLEGAHEVRVVAAGHDPGRLHGSVSALLEAFVHHIEQEHHQLARLSTFTARLIRRGQERILDELIELSLEADQADGGCRCAQLSESVAIRLRLQADAERRAFDHAADRGAAC